MEVKSGMILAPRDPERWTTDSPAMYRIVADQFPGYWVAEAVEHIRADGKLFHDKERGIGEISTEEIVEFFTDVLPAQNIRRVDVWTELGQSWVHLTPSERKKPSQRTHRATAEGLPVCGFKADRVKDLPVRWDPWNRQNVPARRETQKFIPDLGPVTCPKCLKLGGQGHS